MIGKIIAILLALWLIGFLADVNGALIHLLLLVVGMLLLGKLMDPKPLR